MKYLWRLRPFLVKYRLQVFSSLVILLLITAAQLVIPAIIRQVIDVGLSRGHMRLLINAALLILIIGLGSALLSYLQTYLSEWTAAHIGFDLRNQLYDHIQHLPFTFHDYAQTGQLISRCIEDVRAIERFMGYGVVDILRMSLLLCGIIGLLIYQNRELAWIALLPMLPLLLITYDFGSRVGRLFLAVDNQLGELSSRIQENVSGVQVIRAFAREAYEIARFDEANQNLFNARLRVIGEWAKVMPTTHMLVSMGTILILWFGGLMVLEGSHTIGEIVAFNSYLLLLAAPAQQLTWLVNMAGEAVAGVQRTYEILDLAPEIQSPPDAVKVPLLRGRVEFRNVSFQYQGERTAALDQINLVAEPNQIIALIGPTGSGKSSLVNLIPRFYDATHGTIMVDDYDVRRVELVSLRTQIGIVLQTSLLFSTSIRENIAYGRPDAGEDEIITAAINAQAHDFILELPQAYDTVIGERGVTLSGGQRQRIAIARALLMNPRILIMDDSTSSVDTQTEKLLQEALQKLMQDRTTFVIAHRLSTVHRADQILVLENGRIIERGTHHQLLEQDGLYREIYELQLRDQDTIPNEYELTLPEPLLQKRQEGIE